jgi:hypothetical protein
MNMDHWIQTATGLLAFVCWLCGTVLAAGWWKVAAVFFPPYAWYLCAERAMQMAGLI